MVDEIGVEREGALEFGDGGVVPALENQDRSKLSASLRKAGVEVDRRPRQFKGAIERGGTDPGDSGWTAKGHGADHRRGWRADISHAAISRFSDQS